MTATAEAVDLSLGFPIDPDDPRWGVPIWPHFIKEAGFRGPQMVAWIQIANHFRNGADVVVLEAPTGAGKSVIGEGVRRLLGVPSAWYVCNTKGLQDQACRSFPYASVLKGRSNYPTRDRPDLVVANFGDSLSAADCVKRKQVYPACSACPQDGFDDEARWHCDNCHPIQACPYRVAKETAMLSPLAITNTAYFIAECNGPGELVKDDALPFVIVDEADTLESIMLGQIEVVISKRDQDRYGIEPPERKTAPKEGTEARKETWDVWLADKGLPPYFEAAEMLEGNKKTRKELRHVNQQIARLTQLKREILANNIVYDENRTAITFKPIRVDKRGNEMVWRHGQKWLLMSATWVDPVGEMQRLGVEDAGLSYEVVTMPSVFPKENRPIHVKRIADNTFANREEAWPKMVDGVRRVLAKHPNDRVLIHTVSYDFTKFLGEQLSDVARPMFSYTNAKEREAILEEFRVTHAAVLLAPSMDRGVDLPEDDCRVVVITKIPYASTKDKQVQARMHSKGGDEWYAVQTIRKLVQMCGRAVRSETDRADCYILDEQWFALSKKWKHLIPKWFAEALNFDGAGL